MCKNFKINLIKIGFQLNRWVSYGWHFWTNLHQICIKFAWNLHKISQKCPKNFKMNLIKIGFQLNWRIVLRGQPRAVDWTREIPSSTCVGQVKVSAACERSLPRLLSFWFSERKKKKMEKYFRGPLSDDNGVELGRSFEYQIYCGPCDEWMAFDDFLLQMFRILS